MKKKVLIVGGVAGGASTAARLRRNDENAEIVMFEKGEYISFANCGLPYYIGDVIEDRSQLLVQTPEAMKARFNIDVRVQSEVVKINREEKTVDILVHSSGEKYTESYDTLVLSTGSMPLKPPIPGIEAPNIFTIWNIPDTDAIKSYTEDNKPKRAAVIGGGFIGIEMAENFRELNMDVTLIELADQVMAPLDFDMAQIVHRNMSQQGVVLKLNNGVKEFSYKDDVTTITLQSGEKVEADIVLLAIGIRPQSGLAKAAGLEINKRGGIVVDDYLKTNDENIYAIGDVIEVEDFITKDRTMVPLAGPANKQGRIAANNITGAHEKYKGTQGTSIAKVFDLTVGTTGMNEKQLIKTGKKYKEDYHTVITHANSHAGYYPGAIPMTIKAIFDNDGKVLGTQIVGYDGVDKRIDVVATAVRFGATVYDLKDLELAYAPPFSSAKDPINMIGFVGENVLTGMTALANWHEVDNFKRKGATILDVRDVVERDMGYIEGSTNIPVDELRERMGELNKDGEILVYCAVGIRGYVAARMLKMNGFKKVYNLTGGYNTYGCVSSKFVGDGNTEDCCGQNQSISDSGEPESAQEIVVNPNAETLKINACGLQCPGPIMQTYKALETLEKGDVLEIRATDPGFFNDIDVWSKRTGNTLLENNKEGKEFVAKIMKGTNIKAKKNELLSKNNKSMVVFSGDLDKAIAAFIIANGAASMGREVTMFFTFWGLNILRKPEKVAVKKDALARMFSGMLPRGSKKLGLSKMNMAGMGPKMIRHIMKKKNVDALEVLIQQAKENGVRMIACNMSMDLMGITEDELLEGVDMAGVASYLGAAEESDVNLFI